MYRLKSIKLYFLSKLKLFFLGFRIYYFKSKFYNKNLVTFTPSRIFYNPSSFLCASLITASNDFYKITDTSSELLWKLNLKDKLKFENLHSFLWLTKLDRKHNKFFAKKIINSWIDNFFDYDPDTWNMEVTGKRIISWTSNTDIILQDSENVYKKKNFFKFNKTIKFFVKKFKESCLWTN